MTKKERGRYDEIRKLYNEVNKKEKKYIRDKLIEWWSNEPINHIRCTCGEEFHTDKKEIIFYIDYTMLGIKEVKTLRELLHQSAINKWMHHKSHLHNEIDKNHKWSEIKQPRR